MRRRVVWASSARDDIGALVQFLAETSPDYAGRVVDAIRQGAHALGEHDSGRPGRVPGTREKSLPATRQIIVYRVEPGTRGEVVTFLRIIHSARDWKKGGWPP